MGLWNVARKQRFEGIEKEDEEVNKVMLKDKMSFQSLVPSQMMLAP